MKRFVSLILAIIMVTALAPVVFSYYPGYEYAPADPVETVCSELFTDGRTIPDDYVSALSKQMGVCYRKFKWETDDEWKLIISKYPYVLLTLEEGETPQNVQCWGLDERSSVLERLGYNSKYFALVDGEFGFSDGRHAFIILLSDETYTELGLNELSRLDRLYVELSIYYGLDLYFDPHVVYGAQNGDELTLDTSSDVNLDGAVNLKDLVLLKKYVAGTAARVNLDACDQNADGAVNIKDLVAFKKLIAG